MHSSDVETIRNTDRCMLLVPIQGSARRATVVHTALCNILCCSITPYRKLLEHLAADPSNEKKIIVQESTHAWSLELRALGQQLAETPDFKRRKQLKKREQQRR